MDSDEKEELRRLLMSIDLKHTLTELAFGVQLPMGITAEDYITYGESFIPTVPWEQTPVEDRWLYSRPDTADK